MKSDPSTSGEDQREALLFDVEGLTKVYPMGDVEVHALRGVGLQVRRGELLVLLGHSGSGKSTLLNIMGGLDTPTAGVVRYRGEPLSTRDPRDLTDFRRRHVGFVFQHYNLIPSLTAQENVALVTEIAEHPMDPVEALAQVNMEDRRDSFPSQLSGGEQQRVAIARAIAKRPGVLMCDEPTGALDITTGVVVLEVLKRVNEELHTTVLVITHNAAISRMADRVITLADGHISEQRRIERKVAPSEIVW